MPRAAGPRGTIETGFDGERWYNRVVGSYIVANYRDTAEDAERKGRTMAQSRRVAHVVKDRSGEIVRQIRYP